MSRSQSENVRIRLDDERKAEIIRALSSFYSAEFDRPISAFQAEALVDFMLQQIGPSQYNQAISDARKFMQDKLEDLDTQFFEPED